MDFVPSISPRLQRPTHLAPLVDIIERSLERPTFACISVPSQVGKTLTLTHGIAWRLAKRPQDVIAYITYEQRLADIKSANARDFARLAGVSLRGDSTSKSTWVTTDGGGVRARGRNAPITGLEGIKLIIVDDPFKGLEDGWSKTMREKIAEEFFWGIVWSRLQPDTSVIVCHTRWHEDDLIGRIEDRVADGDVDESWEIVNIPAVDDDGRSFAPELWSDAFWAAKKKAVSRNGEHKWWSIYMGQPRPLEGRMFEGVSYFDGLPSGYRVSIGIDLAYTAKTSADFSAAVVLAECDDRCFVLDVLRRQCAATDFAADLRRLAETYPGVPMRWYASGTERGSAQFLQAAGVPVDDMPPIGDKMQRAIPAAAAWKDGRILLPSAAYLAGAGRTAPWARDFVDEILDFSGIGDAHDDQVDALAAAYDALATAPAFVDRPGRHRANPYDVGRQGMGGRTHRTRRATHYG